MNAVKVALALCLVASSLFLACAEAPPTDRPLDVLVVNARVIDGMGNPWFRADVGVRDGRITEIGRLEGQAATRTIDAEDRVLSPGFVDMMGGRTYPLLEDADAAESKLRQGITTMLAGEGTSEVPQNDDTIAGICPSKAARRHLAHLRRVRRAAASARSSRQCCPYRRSGAGPPRRDG